MRTAPLKTMSADDLARSAPFRPIAEALQSLRFGTIQITVHDGKMLQVDVTERHRFTA